MILQRKENMNPGGKPEASMSPTANGQNQSCEENILLAERQEERFGQLPLLGKKRWERGGYKSNNSPDVTYIYFFARSYKL